MACGREPNLLRRQLPYCAWSRDDNAMRKMAKWQESRVVDGTRFKPRERQQKAKVQAGTGLHRRGPEVWLWEVSLGRVVGKSPLGAAPRCASGSPITPRRYGSIPIRSLTPRLGKSLCLHADASAAIRPSGGGNAVAECWLLLGSHLPHAVSWGVSDLSARKPKAWKEIVTTEFLRPV
jgi:hypothetical protein